MIFLAGGGSSFGFTRQEPVTYIGPHGPETARTIVCMTQVFFGGPDQPSGFLRDLLARHVDAVPAGGEILWSTYYFRDLALAEALIRARQRGATVKLCLEASPKLKTANRPVQDRLASVEGLEEGLKTTRHLLPAHLHEKIYYFSHPSPVALVGSFNPSGNTPEDPDVIAKIGDQDRGHNCLVALDDADAVASLRRHVVSLHAGGGGGISTYFNRPARSDYKSGRLNIFHYPRWDSAIVPRLIGERKYDRIRIAASHFRDRSLARLLGRQAQGGASVTVIAHDTLRRVPRRIEAFARAQGLTFIRYAHPEALPMHSKFILLEAGSFRRILFGSMNLTLTSRFLNNEVLVALDDEPEIFAAFDARFAHMLAETRQFRNLPEGHDGHPS